MTLAMPFAFLCQLLLLAAVHVTSSNAQEHLVFAHHVVGFTFNYTQQDWANGMYINIDQSLFLPLLIDHRLP